MPGKGLPRERSERFGHDLLLYGAVRRSGTPHYHPVGGTPSVPFHF